MEIVLSNLSKTWIFDVDGTILKHNGHLTEQGDELLPGVKDFFKQISTQDQIILLTARKKSERKSLEEFLKKNEIHFDYLLCEMPVGERILINDTKPSGMLTAFAVNKKRDEPFRLNLVIDFDL